MSFALRALAVVARVSAPRAAVRPAARVAAAARYFAADAAASSPRVQTFLDRKEVTDRVLSLMKNFEKVDPAKVTPTAHFVNDLGLDSLDAVEVCMALEEEFVVTIPDADAEKILSVEDAVTFIVEHPRAK